MTYTTIVIPPSNDLDMLVWKLEDKGIEADRIFGYESMEELAKILMAEALEVRRTELKPIVYAELHHDKTGIIEIRYWAEELPGSDRTFCRIRW